MNTMLKWSSMKAAIFAAALLMTCFIGRPASAQTQIKAKFTLPFEVRWGKAALPAGDYQLMFAPMDTPGMLVIRDAKSLRAVAFEPINNRADSSNGGSALLIGTRGSQHVVYSLTIAELGETFVYQRPAARNREEARQTRALPVVVAKN